MQGWEQGYLPDSPSYTHQLDLYFYPSWTDFRRYHGNDVEQ